MKKNNKVIIWLAIFIFLILVFTTIGTYALLTLKVEKQGTFNVNVSSKGVDIFTLPKGDDVSFEANVYNFRKDYGHNLSAETFINPTLETTKAESQICYEISVKLPDQQVFSYSDENTSKVPELLMDVMYSTDGNTYEKIIDGMDITTLTGLIKVPTQKDGENYKNIIYTTKNKKTIQYWKVKATFVYLKDVNQEINDKKEYHMFLNANVVEC